MTTTSTRLRKNLVILRAGDAPPHRGWISEAHRDFDLFINYFGKQPDLHEAATTGTMCRTFALFHGSNLALAQPALASGFFKRRPMKSGTASATQARIRAIRAKPGLLEIGNDMRAATCGLPGPVCALRGGRIHCIDRQLP